MFILYADKNQLTVRRCEPVTSGSVGVCTARFQFSPDWADMERAAVFKAGSESRSILLDESNACEIPWEVLVKPNIQLRVGVRGTRDGVEVLPTVWADLGTILPGAAVGQNAQPPTPDLWRQELAGKGGALSYDGRNLSLMSGDKPLSTVQIAGGSGGEDGPDHQFGHGLKVTGTTVCVDTVDDFNGDNTLPMSAAGVQAAVGNIEALLGAI